MSDSLNEDQRGARIEHRVGWEIRLNYYERMLRSMLTMLEDALGLMKADDMPDVVCSLTQVVLALEETWAMVATQKTQELDRQARQLRLARSGYNPDGAS